MSKVPLATISTLAALVFSALLPAATHAAPIAGLTPYARQVNAPVIKEFARTDTQRSAALRGVSQPYPDSITSFLDHQGAWYTPFTQPGMSGPYDLRGRHAPQPAQR